MGLWESIRRAFTTNNGYSITGSLVQAREILTPIDNITSITEGYNKTASVFSIVSRDAEKFGSIPRYVYDATKKEEKGYHRTYQKKSFDENKVDNKLSQLIKRPNEYESQDAFFAKLRSYYKTSGEGFVWLNRGDISGIDPKAQFKKEILEMYVLPSQYVTVVQDPNNMWGIEDYILEANGKRLRLGKANVIHWKGNNLNFDLSTGEHLRGLSPLTPGANTIQQYKDATLASVRMYQNDGAKGVLFEKVPMAKDPVQANALKGVIDRKINNNDIKGAVAYLQGEWNYIDIGKSNTDLGLLEGKNMTWKELCFLLNVPYYFFNPEIAYADANRSMVDWISNSIMPGCKQLDGELNRVLPLAFGLDGKVFIGSDYSELPEVQEITIQLAERLSKLWMIKPNEIRDTLGYEEIPGDLDEIFIPSGLTPLSQINDGMDQVANDLANQGLV